MQPSRDSSDRGRPESRLLTLIAFIVALAGGFAVPTAAQTAQPVNLAAARALVARVVPTNAAAFEVAGIPDSAGHDAWEVESRGETVMLRGSSGVAIASALNWYLEHVAGVNASLPLKPIALPSPLPRVLAKVRRTTPYRIRYFFN